MTAADDLRALSTAATPGPWEARPERITDADGETDLAYWPDSETASEDDNSSWMRWKHDAEFIVWCRNHADALADLADTVKAIPRHYPYGGPEVEDVTGKCLVCGMPWPCPTERAHRALDALEAHRG